jgi:ferric-dicitrate binding protein FerR (iron transport regulator)
LGFKKSIHIFAIPLNGTGHMGFGSHQAFNITRKKMLTQLKKITKTTYVLMALFLVMILVLVYRNGSSGTETGLTTPVTLTPKTTTKLYKSSQLTPQQVAPNQQTYKLEGLAYFEARETENKPLVVVTDLAEITAINAIFTLESNAKETNVTVSEGLVEITQNKDNYKGNRISLNIKPGQIGRIKANTRGVIKTVNKDPNFLAWANQTLFFQNTPLSVVASVMGRVYGYQVTFIDKTASQCRLSRSYEGQTPKEIAAAIAEVFGFDYQIVDQTITFAGSCL